jgi:hypothetical protein
MLGLGSDSLHDAGVLLSLALLLGGLFGLLVRLLSALKGSPPLRAALPVCRMLAVLGALGGFGAYVREYPLSHGQQDLMLGGLAALAWMAIVVLEEFRSRGTR